MPKIAYVKKKFQSDSLDLISLANTIIANYQAQGFSLTLRQLYYQMVTRNTFPNSEKSYDRLGAIINDARLAGLVDWHAIEDRTRNVRSSTHWSSQADIVRAAASSYNRNKWEGQKNYVEVWVEKDALVGILDTICTELDMPYFSCRGYTSQSEMWGAAQRLLRAQRLGKTPIILHLGDHDPSGKDMTRDITDRLALFSYGEIKVDRLALNYDQIEQYQPPPNPAKMSDSRASAYVAEFGYESWELDALEPSVIADLIRTAAEQFIDFSQRDKVLARQEHERKVLTVMADHWARVSDYIEDSWPDDLKADDADGDDN